MSVYAWLDPWVARRPFEGRAALRYARLERPAFGDLDRRLLDELDTELRQARRILDLGAGAGELSTQIAREHPHALVLAVEPSSTFTRIPPRGVVTLRARAEGLPLVDGMVDLAICLSTLRHFKDRNQALRELRRVVAPGGIVHVIELDPEADPARANRHRDGIRSPLTRWVFDPFLLRSGPTAAELADLARGAGWQVTTSIDPLQPVYVLRLT